MGMAQKSDASDPVVANAQIKRSPYHQLETCTLLVLEKKGRHLSAFHSCPYVMFSIIRGRVEKKRTDTINLGSHRLSWCRSEKWLVTLPVLKVWGMSIFWASSLSPGSSAIFPRYTFIINFTWINQDSDWIWEFFHNGGARKIMQVLVWSQEKNQRWKGVLQFWEKPIGHTPKSDNMMPRCR